MMKFLKLKLRYGPVQLQSGKSYAILTKACVKCNSNRISSSFHELGVLCKFFFFRTSFQLNFNAFQAHFNIFLYIFFSYLCNIIQGERRAGLNFIFQKILNEPTMFLNMTFSIRLLWHIKSVNLWYNTVGRRDDDMIVPPSDGPMFILIDWE